MSKSSIISWTTGLLTLALAVFSFILSFNALTDLALKHGVSIPPLFPFVVEFAVVIFSLNALYRSLNSESAKWQWSLIIMSSLIAGTFNVIHADSDIVSKAMAAMPSLFLLLSFESFISLLKNGIKRGEQIATIAGYQAALVEAQNGFAEIMAQAEAVKEQHKAELAQRDSQLSELQKRLDIATDPVKARRDDILLRMQSDPQPTQKELAQLWGVTTQTIQTDLKALNGSIAKPQAAGEASE